MSRFRHSLFALSAASLALAAAATSTDATSASADAAAVPPDPQHAKPPEATPSHTSKAHEDRQDKRDGVLAKRLAAAEAQLAVIVERLDVAGVVDPRRDTQPAAAPVHAHAAAAETAPVDVLLAERVMHAAISGHEAARVATRLGGSFFILPWDAETEDVRKAALADAKLILDGADLDAVRAAHVERLLARHATLSIEAAAAERIATRAFYRAAAGYLADTAPEAEAV
jgi:hypothetical protein